MKFFKQVLAIALGVSLAAFIVMFGVIAMASRGMKEAQEQEEKARAKAEAEWNDMLQNGLHPGLIAEDQGKNQKEN